MTRDIQDHKIKQLIETVHQSPVQTIEKLGSGATSTAWRVSCVHEQLIFRATFATVNRPITYRSEFMIINALHKQGLAVPETLYNSYDHPFAMDEHVSAWAITRLIAGNPILNTTITPTIAQQIADFLRRLHALPVSNFGRLSEIHDAITGQQHSLIEGIKARWCWARLFPYDGSALSDHPIITIAPHLSTSINQIKDALWQITNDNDIVLNHSDLYDEHIFIEGEQLTGIIDFGASFIATRGWEFAVLAYYHGWDTVELILKHYAQTDTDFKHLLQQAHYLAIVIGLYKLDKAVTSKKPLNQQEKIITFIVDTL